MVGILDGRIIVPFEDEIIDELTTSPIIGFFDLLGGAGAMGL